MFKKIFSITITILSFSFSTYAENCAVSCSAKCVDMARLQIEEAQRNLDRCAGSGQSGAACASAGRSPDFINECARQFGNGQSGLKCVTGIN